MKIVIGVIGAFLLLLIVIIVGNFYTSTTSFKVGVYHVEVFSYMVDESFNYSTLPKELEELKGYPGVKRIFSQGPKGEPWELLWAK